MNNKGLSALLAIVGFIALLALASHITTHYDRDAHVSAITADEVVFEDESGNLWGIDLTDEYAVGQSVTLKMHTNGTDSNIYDDYIVEVVKGK